MPFSSFNCVDDVVKKYKSIFIQGPLVPPDQTNATALSNLDTLSQRLHAVFRAVRAQALAHTARQPTA